MLSNWPLTSSGYWLLEEDEVGYNSKEGGNEGDEVVAREWQVQYELWQ